jgi:hypothetical protein
MNRLDKSTFSSIDSGFALQFYININVIEYSSYRFFHDMFFQLQLFLPY